MITAITSTSRSSHAHEHMHIRRAILGGASACPFTGVRFSLLLCPVGGRKLVLSTEVVRFSECPLSIGGSTVQSIRSYTHE